MNAEELKSKIGFKSKTIADRIVSVTGEITISATLNCCVELSKCYRVDVDHIEDIKERIRLMILRSIYDDQRIKFYEAIDELMSAGSYDYNAIAKARENFLKIAKYQMP